MPDELEAVVEAARTGATIFSYLKIGDRFTFVRNDTLVCTKISATSYRYTVGGAAFRTGPRAAVYFKEHAA
jgi:hypothetical protein